MKSKKCPHCNGIGVVFDDKQIGAELKSRRQSARLSARQIGEFVGRTQQEISKLENGQRRWNPQIIMDYKRAIEALLRKPRSI